MCFLSLRLLLQSEIVYEWTFARQNAFQTLKDAVTSAPILRAPDFDKLFELQTDWTKTGLGVVLKQKDGEGKEYVVTYASRSNNKGEANYSSYEGETLAVVWGVVHYRHF